MPMRAACIHALGCIGEGAAGALDSKGTLLALSCASDCLPLEKRCLVNLSTSLQTHQAPQADHAPTVVSLALADEDESVRQEGVQASGSDLSGSNACILRDL